MANYLQIAKLIRCKRIVFAALDDFEDRTSEVQNLFNDSSVPVELLSGKQLFDQYPGRKLQEKSSTEDTTSFGSFEEHLKRFLDWANTVLEI